MILWIPQHNGEPKQLSRNESIVAVLLLLALLALFGAIIIGG
jgi:hypothetical protein